jgi:hypothetical protein
MKTLITVTFTVFWMCFDYSHSTYIPHPSSYEYVEEVCINNSEIIVGIDTISIYPTVDPYVYFNNDSTQMFVFLTDDDGEVFGFYQYEDYDEYKSLFRSLKKYAKNDTQVD